MFCESNSHFVLVDSTRPLTWICTDQYQNPWKRPWIPSQHIATNSIPWKPIKPIKTHEINPQFLLIKSPRNIQYRIHLPSSRAVTKLSRTSRGVPAATLEPGQRAEFANGWSQNMVFGERFCTFLPNICQKFLRTMLGLVFSCLTSDCTMYVPNLSQGRTWEFNQVYKMSIG